MKLQFLNYSLIVLISILLIGCQKAANQKEHSETETNSKEVLQESAVDTPAGLVDFLGTWKGPDHFPLVEIRYENKQVHIREVYGLDADKGTKYTASYADHKITAEGEEKNFYKWTLPQFKLKGDSQEVMEFMSGLGPVDLKPSSQSMPQIDYLPPRNND